MTTWAQMTAEFTLLLADTGFDTGNPQIIDSLRIISWNRAVQHFAVTHTAPLKTFVPTLAASGTGVAFAKPADWLQMAGITIDVAPIADVITLPIPVERRGVSPLLWLKEVDFAANTTPDWSGYLDTGASIYFPDSKVTTCNCWYYAFYPDIVLPTDLITVPFWAHAALQHLAITYMLIPTSIGIAELRAYLARRDAGQPQDNPSRVQGNWHLKQYETIIGGHPGQYRQVAYR